jgi:signal transduction histidine kinase/CheY-like chemotaxis protein
VLYALGVGLMIGVGSISLIYLMGFSLLSVLLLDIRWGLLTVGLNVATLLAIGYLGIESPGIGAPGPSSSFVGWAVVTANVAFVNVSLVLALGAVVSALEGAFRRAGSARDALEHERMALVALNQSLADEMAERQVAEARHAKLEAQFRQAQKMESFGALAGGIAHDFNNLMSVVVGYSELLVDDLSPTHPMRPDLEEIRNAGHRATDLTRQLLAFSRRQVLAPRVIDLSVCVSDMESMLRRVIGEDIELASSCAPNLGKVLVDPGQIQQVIMNLAVNARDAMAQGGMLTIETAGIVLDEHYASEHVGVTPGLHVMLSVSDTGSGMDKATQARMFEPFFTTKEVGKGTGLGLATVFGIVQQSGGTIWVYSEPGAGTTFKLYFPIAHEVAAAKPAVPKSQGLSLRGTETILLVEDEDGVRRMASSILRRRGFRVLEARDGSSALLLSEQHHETIDLLVTDVVMPRMSGRQLAEQLLPARPGMKVLYMSGYTDDAIIRHGILEASVAFIQKPITPDLLSRKVRELLDVIPAG